jgi:tetratricopeptide (TPR) repeat protein
MTQRIDFSSPLLRPDPCEPLDRRWVRNEGLLLRALHQGNVIAFLGSGISREFDYPSWKDFALEVLAETSRALGEAGINALEARNIESLREEAEKAKDKLKPTEFMFLIGACRTALERNGRLSVYDDYIRRRFQPKTDLDRPKDPFQSLLRLPIRRFVTTNYDCEIERALSGCGLACHEDLGLDDRRHGLGMKALDCKASFTQDLDGLERLVRFALADGHGPEARVFHCHGRYDQPRSVIATEDDYRRWYLDRQQGASLAFQQNVELLFGSNPLLFIGYGLEDEDLLRPLRQFIALNPARKGTRPLFALISSFSGEEDYRFAGLFERLGLNVCPIPLKSKDEDLTDALCRKLGEIRGNLDEARKHASEKPKMRWAPPLESAPKPHCEIRSLAAVPAPAPPRLEEAVQEPGVVVLVGPSGCGKSHHLLAIVKSAQRLGFAGGFYWNAHYANESITALEAALCYFDPAGEKCSTGTLYERIVRCLKKGRFLLVIDGCERLLRREGIDGRAVSYSATFHRLLRAVACPESQSTVVIAGRQRPADLDEIVPHGPILSLGLSRATAHDLLLRKPFDSLSNAEEEKVSALCSLLRGHAYGLYLARQYVRHGAARLSSSQACERLQRLVHRLEDELRDKRLHAMVRLMVERLDGDQGGGLARPLLERLSFFLNPVCTTTLELCFKEACKEKKIKPHNELCRPLYMKLVKTGLLVKLRLPGRPDTFGYTVHVTVRSALFRPLQGAEEDPLPAFGLSGFTSGRQGVAPSSDHCPHVRDLFAQILLKAEEDLERNPSNPVLARELCRDAYNLIRTRMEANTAPRWCPYEDYLQYGLRLLDLARRASPGEWTYCEYPDARRFTEAEGAPLYPAELAWLYNDIALAYSAEGHVVEACSLWEKTYEISRLIEDHQSGGSYHLEVLLSLAMTTLERGRLAAAGQYVEDAERILRESPDDDYKARILGLRGLIAHLRGNLLEASDLYERSLALLNEGNNLRAQSVFLKHLADIKLTTQQWGEADLLIRNSRALAESGVFPELVINARISEGHRLSRTGQPVQARLEYNAVLSEARRIGCRKLEVRALTALARLSLDQKDVDGARDQAMQAMSLANELGLGLRKPHCLVVLGLATLEAGQKDLGIAYLRLAKQMADGQGYWSRSREAEDKLRELGVDPEEPAGGLTTPPSPRAPSPPPGSPSP